MAGYREHSFDPNAYEQPGRPLKPYNWVQWTGIALGSVGLVLTTLQVAGQLGWMPQWLGDSPPVFVLLLLGVVLVNSRREPSTLVGSEQLAKNRRLLIIFTAVIVAVLGAATVIQFIGA